MQYVARLKTEGHRTLVDFPDCPGCQTFGTSPRAAVRRAREALEGWLEAHLATGAAGSRLVASGARQTNRRNPATDRAARAAGFQRHAQDPRAGGGGNEPEPRHQADSRAGRRRLTRLRNGRPPLPDPRPRLPPLVPPRLIPNR